MLPCLLQPHPTNSLPAKLLHDKGWYFIMGTQPKKIVTTPNTTFSQPQQQLFNFSGV